MSKRLRSWRARHPAASRARKTIIFSSHIMDFVERVQNMSLSLKRGLIAADGTTKSLREQANAQDGHFEDFFFYFSKGEN